MRPRGFSLVELLIAMALLGLLLGLGMPAMSTWVSNAKTRTVSDALQNGLRLAQAEAVRRHRQVVFFRTADALCGNAAVPSASGNFWVVRSVAMITGDPVETVQCGQLGEVASGVTVTGPTALCFSGAGRQVANADPGLGGTACVLPTTATSAFDVANPHGDRPLRVLVTLAGSVRLCDPARTFSSSNPDGCPA